MRIRHKHLGKTKKEQMRCRTATCHVRGPVYHTKREPRTNTKPQMESLMECGRTLLGTASLYPTFAWPGNAACGKESMLLIWPPWERLHQLPRRHQPSTYPLPSPSTPLPSGSLLASLGHRDADRWWGQGRRIL